MTVETDLQAALARHDRAALDTLTASPPVNGWTVLITAVAAGLDVGWLLGTDGLDVNHADVTGTTALHVAAALAARPALDQLLADHRTDRTVRDRWGRTPLMRAARLGAGPVAAQLLAGTGPAGENLVDTDRATALHHAVAAGSTEVVEALLGRPGLNLAVTDRTGRTAARLAAEGDRPDLVTLLATAAERAGEQPDSPDGEPPPRPPEPDLPDPHHRPGTVEPAQLRRLPSWDEIAPLTAETDTDFAWHLVGLGLAVRRSRESLTDPERDTVAKEATTVPGYPTMSRAGKLRQHVTALHTQHAGTRLGHPSLIDCPPRPQTADAANIARLVQQAGALIGRIVAGERDGELAQVFGPANVELAKQRYQHAWKRMDLLEHAQRIVTDRSGFCFEVGVGGTSTSTAIRLVPALVDTFSKSAVVNLIHEAMHAGNPTVHDHGYLRDPSFTSLSEQVKLDNAAHYEVVPRRVLGMTFTFDGQPFTPAGQGDAPPPTVRQQARREASERLRLAWTGSYQLHTLWVDAHLHRAGWATDNLGGYAGATGHFADSMPYWSKVERLTVHLRAGLDDTATTAATAPVTLLDVALSEGVIRRLKDIARCGADRLATDETTTELLRIWSTEQEEAAANGAEDPATALADLLVLCLCRERGRLTGPPERDARMIAALAATDGTDWQPILFPRSPDDFAD